MCQIVCPATEHVLLCRELRLELIRVRLEGARTEFAQHVSKISSHEEQCEVKRMEGKEAAHQALSSMLEVHLQQLYTASSMSRAENEAATVELRRSKAVSIHRPSWRKFVEAAGRTAAEAPLPEGTAAAEQHTMLRLNMIDCCAMGPTHTQLYPEMIEDAAKEAATFPATFLGICKLPNAPPGRLCNADPEAAVEEAQNAVLEKLKETANHFKVQVVQVHYDADTVKSPKRKYWHPLAVFTSDEQEANGSYKSLFMKRSIWVRGSLGKFVECMSRADYRHWTADCSSLANVLAASADNEVSDLRQHHSGLPLNLQLLKACLHGFSTKLTVQVRDWTPADDTLSQACMALNSEKPRSLPRIAYTATAWEHFLQIGAGKRLISNLNTAMAANLRKMVLNQEYELPGLRAEDFKAITGSVDAEDASSRPPAHPTSGVRRARRASGATGSCEKETHCHENSISGPMANPENSLWFSV